MQTPIGGGGRSPTKKKSAPKPPPPSKPYSGSPGSDVRSSGTSTKSSYGIKKATTFKTTVPYRGAIRAAYKAQPAKKRSAQISDAAVQLGGFKLHDSGPIDPTIRKRGGAALNEIMTILKTHNDDLRGTWTRDAAAADAAAKFPGMTGEDKRRLDLYRSQPHILSAKEIVFPGNPTNPLKRYQVEMLDPKAGKIIKGIYSPGQPVKDSNGKTYMEGAGFAQESSALVDLAKFAMAPIKVAASTADALASILHSPSLGLDRKGDKAVQQAGFITDPGGVGAAVRNVLQKGALATGSVIVDGLAIPGHELRKELGHSIGLHGNDISGADIAQHLGLPKQIGLGVDLATDPVMWGGIGLAPESGGASLELVMAKLNKVAPELIHTDQFVSAAEHFAQHGDSAAFARDVRKLLTKATVPGTSFLRRRTPAEEAMRTTSQKTIEDALAKTPGAAITYPVRKVFKGGKQIDVTETHRIPDQAGLEAVTQAMRASASRAHRPQLELRLLTPMGRRTRFNVAFGPDLSHVPIPFTAKTALAARIHMAQSRARIEVHQQRIADLNRLDQRIAQAGRDGNKDLKKQLIALRAKTDREYRQIGAEAIKAAEDSVNTKGLMTVGDRVALSNSRKQIHAGRISADEYGRTVQGVLNRAYEKALRPVEGKDRIRSAERVRLFLEVEADTHGTGLPALEHLIGPLTAHEKQAAENLRAIHKMEREHMINTGLLDARHVNEGYAGYRLYDHPGRIENAVMDEARRFGGTTGPLHRRTAPAFADATSEGALAQKLQALSDHKVDPAAARAYAKELWDSGSIRVHAELLARDIVRDGPRDYASLNQFERHAANYGALHGLDPHADEVKPLFATPQRDETGALEGDVELRNHEHYGFNPEALASLKPADRSLARLYSLVQDRQHLDHLVSQAELAGRQDVAQSLIAMRERLTEKIKTEDPSDSAGLAKLEELVIAAETAMAKLKTEHEYGNKISGVEAQIEALKAEMDAVPTKAAAPAEASVPLKLHHFKIEKEFGTDWVANPATEIAGRTWSAPPKMVDAMDNVLSQLSGSYDTKKELSDELKAVIAEHNDLSAAEHVAPVAAAPDHTGAIVDLAKERKGLVSQRTAALKAHDKAEQVKQAGISIDDVPEAGLTAELDAQGMLWLRSAEHVTPPIEGMKRHEIARTHEVPRRSPYEAGIHDDPYDYVGKLPDFRAPDTEGVMLRLDPRESGYIRSKGHGLAAAFQARFKTVDEISGRSANEARKQSWHSVDGNQAGDVKDLIPHFDAEGAIVSYSLRSDRSVSFTPAEIVLKPKTLLESEDGTAFVDAVDGTPYYFPRGHIPDNLGLKAISNDRLWPAQVIADVKSEMLAAGDVTRTNPNVVDEYRSLYDLGLQAGVQKYLSIARFGVTTPFPAYHVRNMLSDLIKSLQADTGVLFHPLANFQLMRAAYGRGLNSSIRFPGLGKMRTEDFLFVADMFGVRTGHHVAEVAQVLKKSAAGEVTMGNIERHLRNSWWVPGGKSTKFGAKREDVVRFMTFAQRLRANGGDAADAAWYMTRHHFNFNDLNYAEKKFARNLFLFYTWYRKNIPLQLAELARRPGFFAALGDTTRTLAAGNTPLNWIPPLDGAAPGQPALPDYVHNQLGALTMDWNGYALNVGFGAPWNDLAFVSSEGVLNTFILANPIIGAALQLKTRRDLLTNREFKNDEASGAANILSEMGVNLPKDADGNALLPWAVNVILRQLPLVGRASYSLSASSKSRDQGRLQTWSGLLAPITGLNVFVSPKPGSAREKYALGQLDKATAAERQTELTRLGNLKHGTKDDLKNPQLTDPRYTQGIQQFDEAMIQEWTRRLGSRAAALAHLRQVPQSGQYQSQQRRRSGIDSLSGGLGSSLGGGGL